MLPNHRFTELPAYAQLQAHYDVLSNRHMRDMFAED
ncbi:MAG: glucose-6-phosphate isomerase, partial [Spirosoma sp.]|nr:glucose-6-phosphate isomerase [Spirosoma sp.]